MRVDPVSGLVEGVRFVPSPNCDARPAGGRPEVLIVHAISLPPGEFGGPGIERLFCNALDPAAHPYYAEIRGLEVSAHLLVRRDGGVAQFVPLHLRAWHAGQSCCEGRNRVNDFSIGIELEGADDVPFEPRQYDILGDLARAIMRAYPAITPARIYGHADIAPGRKTDPGPHFEWTRLRTMLA
ncbi:1,6-anhydro-N-acetylmuramyl-L-alanine amidase AmpD [Sulfurifustis variabilis]|nr:1,6-anhydro-N-acetylmuramyl-L-alanine amidase AmpD [Sulfurifustis variabilis]